MYDFHICDYIHFLPLSFTPYHLPLQTNSKSVNHKSGRNRWRESEREKFLSMNHVDGKFSTHCLEIKERRNRIIIHPQKSKKWDSCIFRMPEMHKKQKHTHILISDKKTDPNLLCYINTVTYFTMLLFLLYFCITVSTYLYYQEALYLTRLQSLNYSIKNKGQRKMIADILAFITGNLRGLVLLFTHTQGPTM